MDDVHKKGLYRWERQNKPKVQSRSQRVTSTDDIQDWIKKVAQASDKATDAAFGLVAPSGKERGKCAARVTAGHVRDHEEAYSEAQELLHQWVNEKVRFDDDDGFDDLEAWRRKRNLNNTNNNKVPTPTDSTEFNWDVVNDLASDDSVDIDEAAIYERVKRAAVGDEDPYANLFEMEEKDAVSSVLQSMMRKEVVKETFKRDLGFEDPNSRRPDPRTKMELRHKMVKENREKRQLQDERRKVQLQMKKEARLTAQQMVLKEQKVKESRVKKEEMETKKEMARIRKDLQEELRHKDEVLKREAEEKDQIERMAKEELERQMVAEEKAAVEAFREQSNRKKQHMVKVELFKAKQAALNLKVLHQHFTAWYNIILSKRLLLGKVKAMSDWKLMVRVWGAWRSHVRGRRVDFETELHERNVIDSQRKKLVAERHHTLTLQHRVFQAWKLFVQIEQEKEAMKSEQDKTKSKMMSLLSAVAEGKLSARLGEGESGANEKGGTKKGVMSARSAVSWVSSTQTAPPGGPRQAWVGGDGDSLPSSRSSVSCDQNSQTSWGRVMSAGSRGTSIPTEACQVKREHLNLTNEEIAHLGDARREEGRSQQYTNADIRRRFGTQPWMNQQFVVNNFEHRYTAQQQALKDQQKEIKEQKKLIEQLQFDQMQQTLRKCVQSGADPSQLPPPNHQPQGPPQGHQIPRGDTQGHTTTQEGGRQDCVQGQPPRPPSTTETEGGDLCTERSNLTSARSGQSHVTSTTTTSAKRTPSNKYLQVLKNMEDRATERARLKAERDEKRRLQEEEKMAKLHEEEQRKLQEIEDEKKARSEAYRQKKRLEKQKEEERQRQQQREQEMVQRASEHYLRSVMKYRGLLPFKKLISLSKRNWARAVKHRDRTVLRQCVKAWKTYTEDEMDKKNAMADEMNQFLVIKHSFQKWRKYKFHQEFLERRAVRYYTENVKLRYFTAWVGWVGDEREESRRIVMLAEQHHLRYQLRKAFHGWRNLPEQLKREEEKQKRKLELRQKVARMIPDFSPRQSAKVEQSDDYS